jgi:crotonobetainyl-CoA:carnitine CoA-transferase CaiB-like acyl-CoA transferase
LRADVSRTKSGSGRPLEGVLVLDTTTFLAGPFSGLMLADLGAEVVKVEPPGHDPMRRIRSPWHPASPMAANVNRNKRSIVIDMKEPEGRDEFYQLVRRADVALFNMRAPAASALGVDDATLAAINERLIRVWLNGYGQSGPRWTEPAFDAVTQAYAGLISAQSGGGDPSLIRTYVADKVTGMFLVQGVLAALFKRFTTGRGDKIDVSLLDSTAYFAFPDMFEDHTFLDQRPAEKTEDTAAIIGTAADGPLVIAPSSGRQIKAALDVVGHPEWQESLRDMPNRNTLMSLFTQKIRPVLKTATTAEWIRRFSEADVPVAPVLDRAEHLVDAQVVHNRIYQTYVHPEYGRIRSVRYPVLFSGQNSTEPLPFPSPDADRQELSDRLGHGTD